MTEPPEPRRPEEGGGEDDFQAEADAVFEGEWLNELESDLTLDRLGSGKEPKFDEYVDMLDDDADLTDMALDWQDDIDSTPVPPKLDPEELIAESERRKKAAEPPAPRTSETGGSPKMSLQESIGTLNSLANDTSVAGSLQAVGESLNTALAAAQSAVERLAEMAGMARVAVEGNENAAGEIGSTSEHAAGSIEDLIDAVNQAVQAASQTVGHENVFRNTCGSVAARLQS